MPSQTKILLLGAGELGSAILQHISSLPNTHITIGVRKPSSYQHLASPATTLLSLDLSAPSSDLIPVFAAFDIILSCTGFGADVTSVKKLAIEILEAGKLRKTQQKEGKLWFFPWQWGVDYDITGDGKGLMPLFGAQKEVRDLLREKADSCGVKWTIVSTGIFMSFLFEEFWGVVGKDGDAFTVRALGSWDHRITVTDVQDIGRVVARILAGDVESEDLVLYVAGDTVSYAQLADVVGRVTGNKVEKEEWSIEHLKSELEKDPQNGIKKYRLVFAREGVWWDKEGTVNHKLGMEMLDVETYVKRVLV
jgi:hypothetical protein